MSKARKFLVAAAAMTLLLVLGMGAALHGQEEYVPQVQASSVDTMRSQVYLTGKGYELDKQQEKIHQKQEKQREEEKKTEPQQDTNRIVPVNTPTPQKIRSNDAPKKSKAEKRDKKPSRKEPGGKSDPTDPTKATKPSDPAKAKKPSIKCSVHAGEIVDGKRVDFWVSVTDHKGRNVPVFSEADGEFAVSCNGERLSSAGTDGTKTWFRAALADGRNEIVISAADREGNTAEKTVVFTGNTSAKAEVTGMVYVCIDASILNLGPLYESQVEMTKGDSAKDVLEVVFDQAGFGADFKSGYLAGLSRPGIAAGAWISDEVRETLEQMRKTEKDPADQDPDRLQDHDFYDSSGWLYRVNGEFPKKGMGSYKMENGDELYLIFSLAEGVY